LVAVLGAWVIYCGAPPTLERIVSRHFEHAFGWLRQYRDIPDRWLGRKSEESREVKETVAVLQRRFVPHSLKNGSAVRGGKGRQDLDPFDSYHDIVTRFDTSDGDRAIDQVELFRLNDE
jgi:hypothetical protein